MTRTRDSDNEPNHPDKAAKLFGAIIDEFFRDDYSNDNLLDLLYDCWYVLLKLLILNGYVASIAHTFNGIDRAIYGEILDLNDTFFLRLRLLFSLGENYSGGRFITRLKNLPDIKKLILSLYDTPVCKFHPIEPSELKKSQLNLGGFVLDPKNDITSVYTDYPCYIISKKHINDFKQKIDELYKGLYLYDNTVNNYPLVIVEYQRERFHQNNHSNGKKYIIRRIDSQTISKRVKPSIDFEWVHETLNRLSGLILTFANICDFRFGNILKKHRPSNSLKGEISEVLKLYGIEEQSTMVDDIESRIANDLPDFTTVLKIW